MLRCLTEVGSSSNATYSQQPAAEPISTADLRYCSPECPFKKTAADDPNITANTKGQIHRGVESPGMGTRVAGRGPCWSSVRLDNKYGASRPQGRSTG